MQIIQNDNSPFITAVVDGRWVQAKVYNEPSPFGINDGRVSKLAIGKTETRDPHSPFFEQMQYNYDRGLDFDDLPEGLLDSIGEQLEQLPELYTPNC